MISYTRTKYGGNITNPPLYFEMEGVYHQVEYASIKIHEDIRLYAVCRQLWTLPHSSWLFQLNKMTDELNWEAFGVVESLPENCKKCPNCFPT